VVRVGRVSGGRGYRSFGRRHASVREGFTRSGGAQDDIWGGCAEPEDLVSAQADCVPL